MRPGGDERDHVSSSPVRYRRLAPATQPRVTAGRRSSLSTGWSIRAVMTADALDRRASDDLGFYADYHDGALAEYVRAPWWQVDKLPDNVSFEVAAKLNHLATAARAITCAATPPGRP